MSSRYCTRLVHLALIRLPMVWFFHQATRSFLLTCVPRALWQWNNVTWKSENNDEWFIVYANNDDGMIERVSWSGNTSAPCVLLLAINIAHDNYQRWLLLEKGKLKLEDLYNYVFSLTALKCHGMLFTMDLKACLLVLSQHPFSHYIYFRHNYGFR